MVDRIKRKPDVMRLKEKRRLFLISCLERTESVPFMGPIFFHPICEILI